MKKSIWVLALVLVSAPLLLQYPLPALSAQETRPANSSPSPVAQSSARIFLPLIMGGIASPSPSQIEWTQFGANAQHIDWLPQDISNWKYQCSISASLLTKKGTWLTTNTPTQVVTGGGLLYLSTPSSVAAYNSSCAQVWSVTMTPAGTPAYDNGYVYVANSSGTLYKLNAANGTILATFNGSGTAMLDVTVTSNQIIYSAGSTVYALDKNLNQQWAYAAGSPIVQDPTYSVSRNLVIIVTQDLYVSAINNGTLLWHVKPTPRVFGTMTPQTTTVALANHSYPVIAEQHGLVFIAYQLDHDELYRAYTADNSQIRNTLTTTPLAQYLFALNLGDGSVAFVPNVGTAGDEEREPDNTILLAPSNPPVIRMLSNGKEVAYVMCRGRSDSQYDFNWDSSMCELELDGSTSAGYAAGEVRFVNVQIPPNNNYPYMISDEQPYFVGMGDQLVGAHWQAMHAFQITNRADGLGSWTNKIQSTLLPFAVNIEGPQGFAPCTQNNSTHSCGSGLLYYNEGGGTGRLYPPGYWVHWAGASEGNGANVVTVSNNNIIYSINGSIIILKGTVTLSRSFDTVSFLPC